MEGRSTQTPFKPRCTNRCSHWKPEETTSSSSYRYVEPLPLLLTTCGARFWWLFSASGFFFSFFFFLLLWRDMFWCNFESLWFLLDRSVREYRRRSESHTSWWLGFLCGFPERVWHLDVFLFMVPIFLVEDPPDGFLFLLNGTPSMDDQWSQPSNSETSLGFVTKYNASDGVEVPRTPTFRPHHLKEGHIPTCLPSPACEPNCWRGPVDRNHAILLNLCWTWEVWIFWP